MKIALAEANPKPFPQRPLSARLRDRKGNAFGFPNQLRPFRRHSAVRHIARYERVLGTALELQIIAMTEEQCHAAEAAVLREIDRLEMIFSAYRADSELARWQETHARPEPVSLELAAVLQAAEDARQRFEKAFNPAVETLTRLWREAFEHNSEPDAVVLAQAVRAMQPPLWEVDGDRLTATRWTQLPVTLNAVAKGFILDRACSAAMAEPGVSAALVNIGGDIRQSGGRGVEVGIADPFAPQDNANPITSVWLRDRGLATSGDYRRGFQIGHRWRSHILDPRTGYPVDNVVSASVVADSAQTADTLATIFSVLRPDKSLRLANKLPSVGLFLIARNGERHANDVWAASAPPARPRSAPPQGRQL